MPEYTTMGNIIRPFLSYSGKEMSPPKSLSDLLREFDGARIADVDAAINSSVWAKKFRDYLRRREEEDAENTLRFLVLTQPFAAKVAEANNNSKKEKKLKKEMSEIYARAAKEFFSEENDTQVCLSNTRLFEEISLAGKRITGGSVMTDKDADLLLKARSDLDVLQNGLEPQFMKFMSQAKTSTMACILSIL